MSTVKDTLSAVNNFTLTLASLANSAAGVGRQSTLVDNTTDLFKRAIINLKITVGTSPTANTPIYVYLIRQNNDSTPLADDGAGTSDAGLTVVNAVPLGVIIVPATTSNAAYQKTFDTGRVAPSLGPKWGIAVVNNTGVALNSTEGNHTKSWRGSYETIA